MESAVALIDDSYNKRKNTKGKRKRKKVLHTSLELPVLDHAVAIDGKGLVPVLYASSMEKKVQ
jgi:hypothetical protein